MSGAGHNFHMTVHLEKNILEKCLGRIFDFCFTLKLWQVLFSHTSKNVAVAQSTPIHMAEGVTTFTAQKRNCTGILYSEQRSCM